MIRKINRLKIYQKIPQDFDACEENFSKNREKKMTIDGALRWMLTLKARHTELIALRNQNAKEESRFYGERDPIIHKPVYDIKMLDRLVNSVAKEIRNLDEAIKKTNAITEVTGYTKNEDALGEIV